MQAYHLLVPHQKDSSRWSSFRFSQLEEASWGSALVMCLDGNSRSAIYAQFAQQDPQEDFSWDAVVEVLTQFYGATQTQSNQLQQLERLSLHSVTMQAFQQYRDKFTELSAHVSDSQLTAVGWLQTCTSCLAREPARCSYLGQQGGIHRYWGTLRERTPWHTGHSVSVRWS